VYASPVRIELDFGALRDYELQSVSARRWKFLQKLYNYYKNHKFKTTELHFAIDLPYWYDSIKISPKKYLKSSDYPSSKLFDTRKKGKKWSKENIIIYDKCLKAHLAVPLTRIELRLESEELKKIIGNRSIVTDSTLQEELKRKIDSKFRDIIVKKSSHEIILRWSCDRLTAIIAAMEYLQGDDSLLEHLMSHHTDKITYSSKIFAKFLSECKKYGIYQLKPRLPSKLKLHLSTLSREDRKMLADTIANYYRYNRKWYQEEEFLGEAVPHKRKYKRLDSLNEKEKAKIQTLYSQGVSIKRIGIEFGLSESAISRLFSRQSKRRAYVKDSRSVGLFSLCK
jgi:DNA invertase Pin-like site-specific DNA recombinase